MNDPRQSPGQPLDGTPLPKETVKLSPRNASAERLFGRAAGNPVTSRPEAGIGNCFPGLECDLRNLERRFFPGLEVDIQDNAVQIVSVDPASAPVGLRATYVKMLADLNAGRKLSVATLTSVFGPRFPKAKTLTIASLNPGEPPDAWTAVRLIPEGMSVSLQFKPPRGSALPNPTVLTGLRAKYLDDNGALAEMFEPGEITQSLCSPWTHDFRDCACFYWASNHPDIALPSKPATETATGTAWDQKVQWERTDRRESPAPPPAREDDGPSTEMAHLEINARWQELDFVLEGREQRLPYAPSGFPDNVAALPNGVVEQHLRYAAGVELGVIQEYLAAVFSLDPNAGAPGSALRDAVTSARAELMRVALSEMRHLRLVNDMLQAWLQARGQPFTPALAVAATVPQVEDGSQRPLALRILTADVLQEFINIEQPSLAVDGLYARLYKTFKMQGLAQLTATTRSIMSDGAGHHETFLFIQEWLTPQDPNLYLRKLLPSDGDARAAPFRGKYLELLRALRTAYSAGLPGGGAQVNAARDLMLGATGIEGLAEGLATNNLLLSFDVTGVDNEFQPIPPPPP